MPTVIQSIKAVILCQAICNGFQPINIFRYDRKYKTIYIQAGNYDEIAIIIYSDGEWEFV